MNFLKAAREGSPKGFNYIKADKDEPKSFTQKDRIPPPPPKGHWVGWIKPTLKEYWKGVAATPETIGSTITGMLAWPISKAHGVGQLLMGKSEEEARKAEESIAMLAMQPKTEAGGQAMEMFGKGVEMLTWPGKMAGQTAKANDWPKSGYVLELMGEVLAFKMAHKAGGRVAARSKEAATAKLIFDKKMAQLKPQERTEVVKIAKQKIMPKNLVKEIRKSKEHPAETAYETQKDIWIRKTDRQIMEADIEGRLLQKELLTITKNKKQARQYDEAVQIYIDTKRSPEHISEYYDKLSPEQKKTVDLSQNLPEKIKAVADKIADTPETADAARRLWARPKVRETLKVAFENEDQFNSFLSGLEKETQFTDTLRKLFQGSQTAQRQAGQAALKTGDIAALAPFKKILKGELTPDGITELSRLMFDPKVTNDEIRKVMVDAGVINETASSKAIAAMRKKWETVWSRINLPDVSVQSKAAVSTTLAPLLNNEEVK